jgi:Protein of unknown function (DUF3551)
VSGLSTSSAAKQLLKLGIAPIAALSALAFASISMPASAHAYEYCRTDILSHMLQCGFDSLEQCKATSSGRGGDCARDPFLPPADALAYAPKTVGAKHHTKAQAGHR